MVGEAKRVLEAAGEKYGFQIAFTEGDIGGVAIERQGNPYPDSTRKLASEADAILLGAVGGHSGTAYLPLTGPSVDCCRSGQIWICSVICVPPCSIGN